MHNSRINAVLTIHMEKWEGFQLILEGTKLEKALKILWTWNKFWKIGVTTVMNCEKWKFTKYVYIYIMYMHLYYMILYLFIILMCMYSISTYRLKYDLSGKLCRCAWHRWSLGPIEKSTKKKKKNGESGGA